MKKCMVCFLALSLLSGCNPPSQTASEGLFQYKDSYTGDSGAVGSIARALSKPDGEQLKGLELQTTEEPYGIILNYSPAELTEESITDYRELSLYNAGILLALVKNADWVQFNYVEEELKVGREELENWLGTNLREFNSEEELRSFLQGHLEDEGKVRSFFE
jgi:hypothetical protein